MRVLMSTWGWRSHFYCLVPLGWALQAAGHEVRVASHPSMAEAITTAGLAAVPLGDDVNFADTFSGQVGRVGRFNTAAWSHRDAVGGTDDVGDGARRLDSVVEPEITADGGVVRLATALLDDLVAYGRAYRPDLVVWEPLNLAAAVAAAALGVAGVQQLWGPDSSVTLRLDTDAVLGPLAGRFGLHAAEVSLPGDLLLDPVPEPMQVALPAPSQPIRFVPYNGVAIEPDWLRAPPTRRRVCITGGTMMPTVGLADRIDMSSLVRAVAELDVEVVVALEPAQRQGLGALPGNVRVVGAPLALRLVLPTCAALVQQGGAGTMMTALDCGVPQLILPQVSDQHFNGERLATTGAGTWLAAERAGRVAIRDTVADLIDDPRWRTSALQVRERMHRRPAPTEVVAVLERLAAGDRPAALP